MRQPTTTRTDKSAHVSNRGGYLWHTSLELHCSMHYTSTERENIETITHSPQDCLHETQQLNTTFGYFWNYFQLVVAAQVFSHILSFPLSKKYIQLWWHAKWHTLLLLLLLCTRKAKEVGPPATRHPPSHWHRLGRGRGLASARL